MWEPRGAARGTAHEPQGAAGGPAGAAVLVSGQMPPSVSAWGHVRGKGFLSPRPPLLSPTGHGLLNPELQAESRKTDVRPPRGLSGSRVMEGPAGKEKGGTTSCGGHGGAAV